MPFRRNSASHAGGVGPLLFPAQDLAPIAGRQDVEGPAGVRTQLKVVSTDVCQHRDCDRFRATHTIGACRPLDGGAVPPALCRRPDAAPRSAPRLTASRARTHRSRQPGANPLTFAPSDVGGARRFFARTGATACASAPPIGRRRLCAPRPPAWPIAPDSTRARDEARESARRSRLERWPKSMAHDGRLGGPSAHSTTAETPWQPRESREPGGGERSSGCHGSPAAARPAPPPAAS